MATRHWNFLVNYHFFGGPKKGRRLNYSLIIEFFPVENGRSEACFGRFRACLMPFEGVLEGILAFRRNREIKATSDCITIGCFASRGRNPVWARGRPCNLCAAPTGSPLWPRQQSLAGLCNSCNLWYPSFFFVFFLFSFVIFVDDPSCFLSLRPLRLCGE